MTTPVDTHGCTTEACGYVGAVEVDTGLDTKGCDVEGPDSSGNLMTGLACDMVSSSGKAVISGPLVEGMLDEGTFEISDIVRV